MSEEELCAALHYGTHFPAKKEVEFVHQGLAEQVQAGNIVVFPLDAVQDLPKLWISPVSTSLQVGRRPRFIFDFTWSGLNEATAQKSPE